jgi:hypothetical protein
MISQYFTRGLSQLTGKHNISNVDQENKHIERQLLNELISRLVLLGYPDPTDIQSRESPDFSMIMSGESIGVELTRSTVEEYCRASRQLLGGFMVYDRLRDYGVRRPTEKLLADATDLTSEWTSADEQMRDWERKVAKSLVRKRLKLKSDSFEKFSHNWLLIYDFPPLGNDKNSYNRAAHYLSSLFAQPTKAADFDTVFILSNHYLFRWHGGKLDVNYYTGQSTARRSPNSNRLY